MLLRLSAALVLTIAVAGCSGGTMPTLGIDAGPVDPLPPGYEFAVAQSTLKPKEAGALISAPALTDSWDYFDHKSWYVCVRHLSGQETVVFLEGGRVQGSIEKAGAHYCNNAKYSALVAPVS